MYWASVQRMTDLMDVGKLIYNFGCLGAKYNYLWLPILREISLKLWCVSLFLKKLPFSCYSICTSTKLLLDSLNYLLGQYCKSHEAQNPFTSTVGERTKKEKKCMAPFFLVIESWVWNESDLASFLNWPFENEPKSEQHVQETVRYNCPSSR